MAKGARGLQAPRSRRRGEELTHAYQPGLKNPHWNRPTGFIQTAIGRSPDVCKSFSSRNVFHSRAGKTVVK